MANSSATGGILTPALLPVVTVQDRLLQSLIAGLTGLAGANVRPLWQQNPPKQPEVNVDWCGFGIAKQEGDKGGAYVRHGERTVGNVTTEFETLQRYEALDIQVIFYGPNALEYAGRIRDGLEIAQNRDTLRAAGLGVSDFGPVVRMPELVNEQYYNRADVTFKLSHEINREYSILSFVSSAGVISSENIENIFEVTANQ